MFTPDRAGEFYAVHKERPFYKDLCKYMSSGAIVPMILEKDNAVEDFRKLIGATDPSKALLVRFVAYLQNPLRQMLFMALTATRMLRLKETSSFQTWNGFS